MPRHIGPDPFETFTSGKLKGSPKNAMICVYPSLDLIVTGAGTHGDCHLTLVEHAASLGLDSKHASDWRNEYVAGVNRGGQFLLRDDGHPMCQVFRAAEILEEAYPEMSQMIRYLGVLDSEVLDAVRKRGELWRIIPPAQTTSGMNSAIDSSKVHLNTEAIYYYNARSGTRYLTKALAVELLSLPPSKQIACANEIATISQRKNKRDNAELTGFNTTSRLSGSIPEIIASLEQNLIDPSLGGPETLSWTGAMYNTLTGISTDQKEFLGLSSELKMKIDWLPGAYSNEALIFHKTVTERVQGLIQNLFTFREKANFVNVGSLIETCSLRNHAKGRREVYVIELGIKNAHPEVCIIRMQDWDTWHYLEGAHENTSPPLEVAEEYANEYTRYMFLCSSFARFLGVNKQDSIPQTLTETYLGKRPEYYGQQITAHYSIRRYVYGMATDKVPDGLLKDKSFSTAMARLMGQAAAPNMIAGRATPDKEILFNDGDEYLMLDNGIPKEVRVGDVTGCLSDFERSFEEVQSDYEERMKDLFQWAPYCRAIFIGALVERYQAIRDMYLANPKKLTRTLDISVPINANLRLLSLGEDSGSFRFRVRKVLERLERTTSEDLREIWAKG